MPFGLRQLASALTAIALGGLFAVMVAPLPLTADDGYDFGFRHGAVTGYAMACLTAAVALWLGMKSKKLRRMIVGVTRVSGRTTATDVR